MLALDATELTEMRDELEDTWPDTAEVLRNSAPLSDGRGGVELDEDVAATSPCRLIPVRERPREDDEAAKVTSVTRWKVLLRFNLGVRPGDRLRVNSLVYDVLGDNGDRSHPLCENVAVRRAQ